MVIVVEIVATADATTGTETVAAVEVGIAIATRTVDTEAEDAMITHALTVTLHAMIGMEASVVEEVTEEEAMTGLRAVHHRSQSPAVPAAATHATLHRPATTMIAVATTKLNAEVKTLA